MAFVQVIHWKPSEAADLVHTCRHAGFESECHPNPSGTTLIRALRENPPIAVVIDLNHRPSHGRELGAWLRKTKKTRHIPIIYVDGDPDKVERLRSMLPDAVFTSRRGLASALKSAIRKGVPNPQMPPPDIVRFGGRSAAQKIGIKPGTRVGVIDSPPDWESLLDPLPEGVELVENPAKPLETTLWFQHDFDGLMSALHRMRRLAPRTRLWLVWRKGGHREVTYQSILTAGAEVGLVLAKLCAVNSEWSAVWLVPPKAPK